MFKKDTTLKANLFGINVILEFNGQGIINNFKEIDTNYLHNINVDALNELRNDSLSKIAITVKAVLTIKRKMINKSMNKYESSFEQMVYDCLIDEEYKDCVSLVIIGRVDDVDIYNEFYDCEVCKYFITFNRVPKMKLSTDISKDDLMLIIEKWLDNYLFKDILVNSKIHFDINNVATEYILTKDDITWKYDDYGNIYLFISMNHRLYSMKFNDFIITHTENINELTFYKIGNHVITSNISNHILANLPDNILYTNKQFKLNNI